MKAKLTATNAAPPMSASTVIVSGLSIADPNTKTGSAAANADSEYTEVLNAVRSNGFRSTSCAVSALIAATSTASCHPKRMTEARMKTKASETVLRFSSSSGTGFSSATSASDRNRRTARPSSAPGGSRAMLTPAPTTTGIASARAVAIRARSRGG